MAAKPEERPVRARLGDEILRRGVLAGLKDGSRRVQFRPRSICQAMAIADHRDIALGVEPGRPRCDAKHAHDVSAGQPVLIC